MTTSTSVFANAIAIEIEIEYFGSTPRLHKMNLN